ncbi:MAG: hypothetical protein AAGI90_06365 [Chlamydiota bacterium]
MRSIWLRDFLNTGCTSSLQGIYSVGAFALISLLGANLFHQSVLEQMILANVPSSTLA